jgi:two-component system alkaline phosphatase synthesis response regulator PhoP
MAIKVLIADDEEAILGILANKVAAQDYAVVTARDGQEAWDKIVSENPDVIILDITMPKMDGWSVLHKLRSEPPSKKWQPVIIVSALGEMENVQKGLDLEADHYLTKPCRIEDVLKGIRLMVSLIPARNQ